MTKKIALKIFVDVAMTVVYILLMFDFGLGDWFHEIAGIAIGAIFILHVALNIKPFKAMLKQLKNGKLSFIRTILLISDIILPFTMITVIATGMLIAKKLYFIEMDGGTFSMIFTIHNFCAYVTLGIMALHLLLHAKYLVGVFKKGVKNGTGKTVSAVCSVAMLAFFCYMIGYSLFFKNPLQTTTDVLSTTTPPENTTSEPVIETTSAYNETENTYTELTNAPTEQITEQNVETEQITTESAVQAVSLDEFLSKLFCTGCRNRCPLTSPRCSTGRMQAQEAEQSYYEEYNISE